MDDFVRGARPSTPPRHPGVPRRLRERAQALDAARRAPRPSACTCRLVVRSNLARTPQALPAVGGARGGRHRGVLPARDRSASPDGPQTTTVEVCRAPTSTSRTWRAGERSTRPWPPTPAAPTRTSSGSRPSSPTADGGSPAQAGQEDLVPKTHWRTESWAPFASRRRSSGVSVPCAEAACSWR